MFSLQLRHLRSLERGTRYLGAHRLLRRLHLRVHLRHLRLLSVRLVLQLPLRALLLLYERCLLHNWRL